MKKQGYIYIITNKIDGVLYIGVTSNLIERVGQHKEDLVEGFTKKYCLHMLVYYDVFEDILSAIIKEKQMKKWKRQWKIELIEIINPNWKDLYDDLL